MIEFAFAITIIFLLLAGRGAIRASASALEDTSNAYLEEILADNAIERQIRIKELDERMAEMGITKLYTHEDFLKRLGR